MRTEKEYQQQQATSKCLEAFSVVWAKFNSHALQDSIFFFVPCSNLQLLSRTSFKQKFSRIPVTLTSIKVYTNCTQFSCFSSMRTCFSSQRNRLRMGDGQSGANKDLEDQLFKIFILCWAITTSNLISPVFIS